MTIKQKLLVCLAHPDDEAFGSGGSLAHYAARGVETTLVCATGGEVGEISDPELATPENLAEVREAELRCACQALDITTLIMLGYRDSGMVNTPENEDPRAFLNTPADEVVTRLVGIIRELRPQVVVTFDPSGGYGHPDHITIHQHTVTAFHAAADATQYPQQGQAWQPQRLLYTVFPRSFFESMAQKMVEAGVDVESEFEGFDTETIGYPDDEINGIIQVADFVAHKQAALECHRTQFGPDNPFNQLPQETITEMMSTEYFASVWPESETNLRLTDLFA